MSRTLSDLLPEAPCRAHVRFTQRYPRLVASLQTRGLSYSVGPAIAGEPPVRDYVRDPAPEWRVLSVWHATAGLVGELVLLHQGFAAEVQGPPLGQLALLRWLNERLAVLAGRISQENERTVAQAEAMVNRAQRRQRLAAVNLVVGFSLSLLTYLLAGHQATQWAYWGCIGAAGLSVTLTGGALLAWVEAARWLAYNARQRQLPEYQAALPATATGSGVTKGASVKI